MAGEYTEADLVAITTAIKSGALTVVYQDKKITYQSLAELRSLRSEMISYLYPTTTEPKFREARFRRFAIDE